MKSRYSTQRDKARSRYKTRLKAQQGIHFPEKQNVPSTLDVAGGTFKGVKSGAQAGSSGGLPGMIIGAAGGGLITGISGAIARQDAIKANQYLRDSKETYDDNYFGYTDNKLMQARGYAESGEADANAGLIEIEGKNGTGELHFDKDWNLKNVGSNPHSNGGDVVEAEEGDMVIPTQGDPAFKTRVMKLVNQYKHGDKSAAKKLQAIVDGLPDDREVADKQMKSGIGKSYNKYNTGSKNILPPDDLPRQREWTMGGETISTDEAQKQLALINLGIGDERFLEENAEMLPEGYAESAARGNTQFEFAGFDASDAVAPTVEKSSEMAYFQPADGGEPQPIMIDGRHVSIDEWVDLSSQANQTNDLWNGIVASEVYSHAPIGYHADENGRPVFDSKGLPYTESAWQVKQQNETNPGKEVPTDAAGEPVKKNPSTDTNNPKQNAATDQAKKSRYQTKEKTASPDGNLFTTDLNRTLEEAQGIRYPGDFIGPIDPKMKQYIRSDGERFFSDNMLGEDGTFVDEQGNPVYTDEMPLLEDRYTGTPFKMNKEEALGYLAEGKHNWDQDSLRKFMADHDIDYTEARDYALANYGDEINLKDFGAGTQDNTTNIGPMTTGVFSRNYKKPGAYTATLAEQEAATGFPDEEQEQEQAAIQPEKEGGKFNANDFLRYGNALGNIFEGMGKPEEYDPTPLQLDRYRYQDMSASRMQKANEADVVRRANRQRLVASKGQHAAQAAQDEVMAAKQKQDIMADEIARQSQIENLNVGQRDKEAQWMGQEMLKKKDFDARSRAALRNIGRQGYQETQDVYDVLQQEGYMKSRDAKLDARDDLLLNFMLKEPGTFTYGQDAQGNLTGDLNLSDKYKVEEEEDDNQ